MNNRNLKVILILAVAIFFNAAGAGPSSGVGVATCASVQPTKMNPQKGAKVLKFFKLVNQTGGDIEVRVFADQEALFTRRLKGKKGARGLTHPDDRKYPTVELKVMLNENAKQLTIQESCQLKRSESFDITAAGKESAGFQVIIRKDVIELIQDYQPAR